MFLLISLFLTHLSSYLYLYLFLFLRLLHPFVFSFNPFGRFFSPELLLHITGSPDPIHIRSAQTDSLKMGTKVKGFFKGLKNISNIFDEDEEPNIQIGMPTDVKHVAHIGADGPATESPSWMRGFNGSRSQSGPIESSGSKEGIKNHRSTRSEVLTRDIPNVSKASRHRRRSMDNSSDSDSQSSNKSKHRRHRIRRSRDTGNLPDIPKRSRRKKSRDDDGSTRSKDSESSSYEPHLDL